MADRISIDTDRMDAAGEGMRTFTEQFNQNLTQNQAATTDYLDAFGADEFGKNLKMQYDGMAEKLWTGSSSLSAATDRVATNAGHSSNAWKQTNDVGGVTGVPSVTEPTGETKLPATEHGTPPPTEPHGAPPAA